MSRVESVPTASLEGASFVGLLTRMACTTERTLEMVENLRREHDALRRTLNELEDQLQHEPAVSPLVDGTAVPVAPGEYDQHRWLLLARDDRGHELVLATGESRGLRPALLRVSDGRARRALLLGPLEESLLLRLWSERRKAEEQGGAPEPLPAKILASRLVAVSPFGDRLRSRPAPGTVRSAFTRLRKKIQRFCGSGAVLVGGREGYRLACPAPLRRAAVAEG